MRFVTRARTMGVCWMVARYVALAVLALIARVSKVGRKARPGCAQSWVMATEVCSGSDMCQCE